MISYLCIIYIYSFQKITRNKHSKKKRDNAIYVSDCCLTERRKYVLKNNAVIFSLHHGRRNQPIITHMTEKRKMMKKSFVTAVSCLLIIGILFSSSAAFAAPFKNGVDAEEAVCVSQESNGEVAFFKKTSNVTVNATLETTGVVHFYMVYASEPTTLYYAEYHTDLYPETAALAVSFWNELSSKVFSEAKCEKDAIIIDTEFDMSELQGLRSSGPSVYDIFYDEMTAIYGEPYDGRFLGQQLISGTTKYATVRENFNIGVEYKVKVKTARDLAIAALASLLGISSNLLVKLIGTAISVIPKGTEFYKYSCSALFDRVGSVSNVAYYIASHELGHIGIFYPESVYESCVLVDAPYYDFYYPDQQSFDSVLYILQRTIALYNAS